MKFSNMVIFVVTCAALLTCSANAGQDTAYQLVPPGMLLKSLENSDSFDVKEKCIAHAYNLGEIGPIYQRCAIEATNNPKSAQMQVLYGMSAFAYYLYLSIKSSRQTLYTPDLNVLYKNAYDALKKGYDIAPNIGFTNAEYGYFLWWNGKDKIKGAQLVNNSTLLSPNSHLCHFAKAVVYETDAFSSQNKLNDLKNALSEIKTCISLEPNNSDDYMLMGNAYFNLGNKASAENAYSIMKKLRQSS